MQEINRYLTAAVAAAMPGVKLVAKSNAYIVLHVSVDALPSIL